MLFNFINLYELGLFGLTNNNIKKRERLSVVVMGMTVSLSIVFSDIKGICGRNRSEILTDKFTLSYSVSQNTH